MHPKKGLYVKTEKGPRWVTKPIYFLGRGRNPFGRDWGHFIRFQNDDNQWVIRYIPGTMVAGDLGALCGSLISDGLVIARTQYMAFASYLSLAWVKSRVITVDRTGWHNIKGRWHFVLPKETIGAFEGERVILKEVGVDYYEKWGTLADWQAGIGSMAKGEGSLILNISSALVASLSRITGINASGLNVVDDTSKGKSTCQYAGATVWGRGGKGGFVQPWNATINGIEAVAVLFNDTLLSLDDMKQAAPQVVSEALYMIHNGVGRVRMDRARALQETNKWSTFVMSSSEQSVETRLREAGIKVKGGQDVRLPEIPADRGHGVGAFDKPKTKAEASAFAEKVESASKKNYGWAGPEFERCVIAAGVEKIASRVQGEVAAFIKTHVKAGANEQVQRVAKIFALIASAGELLIEFKIAPWDKDEALAAAKWAFDQWIVVRGGTGSSEAKRQIAQIRELIGRRRFDGFATPNKSPDGSIPVDQRAIHDCAGYTVGKGETQQWWFTVEQWKAACKGFDPNKVAETLCATGVLIKDAGRQLSQIERILDKPTRVRVVTSAIFDDDKDE